MALGNNDPIRIVVVDDSPAASDLLVSILQNVDGFEVVGVGRDGRDAIRLTKRLKPDVVTMDIIMPVMDGMEATRIIMSECPTPIVVVSGTLSKVDIIPTFNAISEGALSMVRKPGIDDHESVNEIIKTVRAMAGVPTVRRFDKRKPRKLQPTHERQISAGREEQPAEDLAHPVFDGREVNAVNIIGIVSSTGGPGVLAEILKTLPRDFHIPIMIVQHVTDGFAVGLADWLDRETDIIVGLASHGERPRRGAALVAPDGYHTRIDRQGNIELFKADPYKGLLPSGNYLLNSISDWYRSHAMGIILTGMGDDGVEGMESIHRNSGVTIAQEEKSCVVYGMPKEAVKLNAVDYILDPPQIGSLLKELIRPAEKEVVL